ncbi:MAG: hypothetical protein ABSF66_07650 [Terriglobales bacterium]
MHECDGTDHFARNQQRRGDGGARLAIGEPAVTGGINVVEEEGATPLNRLNGDGWGIG